MAESRYNVKGLDFKVLLLRKFLSSIMDAEQSGFRPVWQLMEYAAGLHCLLNC